MIGVPVDFEAQLLGLYEGSPGDRSAKRSAKQDGSRIKFVRAHISQWFRLMENTMGVERRSWSEADRMYRGRIKRFTLLSAGEMIRPAVGRRTLSELEGVGV